ncbi:MAG: Carboxylesterase [uncultured Gemmatimonadaceae bacterium]|uniref:Carboxylesterase n=1 Tax=uncultured Gemmatimonadaceae bacterium TaxID=246130 RepID=A0A6J4KGX4_9BACT|nr:MAG: Carboxylesterase [uncultured Gemmatimonadaceae bacterium]
MAVTPLDFVHQFVPAAPPAGGAAAAVAAAGTTLLLLHGTGGDENDLLPLGRAVAPGAALLSPRGKVLEGSAPRFFRRLAEGVFDVPDLLARTHELAAFVGAAAAHYGFDARRVVALGFSNGANIAASALLLHPQLLAGAVLLRAMVPFEPTAPVTLPGTPVYLGAGRFDPIIPPENSARLAALLEQSGARTTLAWQPTGHQLAQPELAQVRDWMAANVL